MTKLGDLFLIPEWTADERENVARLLSRIESIALDLGSRIDARGNATELRAGSVSLGTAGLVVTVGGVEKLRVDDGGLLLGNNLSTVLAFKAADGTQGMRITSDASDFLNLINDEAGNGINLVFLTTAGASQELVWREDPALAERPQLNLGVGPQGTKFTIGGEVEIHGGAGSVTTVFNEVGRDIDFRVEGDTITDVFGVDAGLDAVTFGNYTRFDEVAAPGTPAAGTVSVYAKTDGLLYSKDDAGAESLVSGGYTQNARVYHSASQNLLHNTLTYLAFDSENFDTDTIHDPSTNNTRLTCKTAGKYHIYGQVRFPANVTGDRYILLHVNRNTYIATSAARATASLNCDIIVSTDFALAVNDYVELQALQDSGVTLAIGANGPFSPVFGMTRVG